MLNAPPEIKATSTKVPSNASNHNENDKNKPTTKQKSQVKEITQTGDKDPQKDKQVQEDTKQSLKNAPTNGSSDKK